MPSLKVLILLKQNYTSGGECPGEHPAKAGLYNSAEFLAEGLRKAFGLDYRIRICEDANSIDHEVFEYKPNVCILEALWFTPDKLFEIQQLHPGVLFIVRINSKIPFLALEGMSIGWLKEYLVNAKKTKESNLLLSSNNADCSRDLNWVGISNVYLPNLYPDVRIPEQTFIGKVSEEAKFTLGLTNRPRKRYIDVGCFGAIRPLKNQLIQAFAAIELANKNNLSCNFHINGSRVEQKGEEPLKNMRALFHNTRHRLVEHAWLTHIQFLGVLRQMDICMQVSYTESFNIVTADAASQHIPLVVSPDIDWVPQICQANPNDAQDIIEKMNTVLGHRPYVIRKTAEALNHYTKSALRHWWDLFYPIEE